ncbi:MAG: aspartate--tRNA ligase [Candidatus Nealsonbacteria bacterium]|nr:aspartate--tRNA ligase [Candidatus Nealsonbacteria bacterium]
MERIFIKETPDKIGEKVRVCGWVQTVRTHGKIMFFDLRDKTGIIQVVIIPNKDFFAKAKEIRSEWVVALEGTINQRPQNMVNDKIGTGQIEMLAEGLEVFSRAETLPFPIDGDGYEISEDNRLKYRYLDLRRTRLQKNLVMRHKVFNFIRNFFTNEGFIEVETPILTRSTPEGARDFLVPSRLQAGNFYALPQSPQQFKQLLMVAGLERYFQLPICFRDEDTRGNRQPEFTQLDFEMSFVEREDVMAINEKLLVTLVKEVYPKKIIQEIPFPRLTYAEAMGKYLSDKPDLRKDKNNPDLLAFCWVIDFPFFEKTEEGGWTFTHNPFSAPAPEFRDDLLEKRNIPNIIAAQYDIALNGFEVGGGSIRNHQADALEAVFEIMGFSKQRIQENFGHMLEAFKYGAPPHGGTAWGMERLMMILENEPNIREVMAFPKTGDGRDLMLDCPAVIEEARLKELHIKIEVSKEPDKN